MIRSWYSATVPCRPRRGAGAERINRRAPPCRLPASNTSAERLCFLGGFGILIWQYTEPIWPRGKSVGAAIGGLAGRKDQPGRSVTGGTRVRVVHKGLLVPPDPLSSDPT